MKSILNQHTAVMFNKMKTIFFILTAVFLTSGTVLAMGTVSDTKPQTECGCSMTEDAECECGDHCKGVCTKRPFKDPNTNQNDTSKYDL